MDFEQELYQLLQKRSTAPFLFVGSGFSKRYIGLENWNDLLEIFANKANLNFSKYKSKANSVSEKIATYLAAEYSEKIWDLDEYKELLNKEQKNFQTQESALKYAISDYLKKKSYISEDISSSLLKEIETLKSLDLDGIITTNWDTFLEDIFPKYTVYIGQEDLIFNQTYSVGEIYKIHGSIKEPESLVLTSEDYENFEKKNPYLAAKLITIFVEHPIIFMGYSLSDSNITKILNSIIDCLDSKKLQTFQENLIFVSFDHNPESQPNIGKDHIVVNNNNQQSYLPITHIYTHSFLPIFEVIQRIKRQIPIPLIRRFKEHIYNITTSTEPSEELKCYININNSNIDNVQYVLGFGKPDTSKNISSIGYDMIPYNNIAKNLLNIEPIPINSEEFLIKTAPKLSGYVPKYKYLRELGINSQDSFNESKYNELEIYNQKGVVPKIYHKEQQHTSDNRIGLNTRVNRRMYDVHHKNWSIKRIIEELPIDKQLIMIPCAKIGKGDIELIKNLLVDYYDEYLEKENTYRSNYRKLLCFYDYLVYGWK